MIAFVLHLVKIILIVVAVFFVVTFLIYFFNLDMKLTAALQGPIQKLQEKVKRDRHL